MPDNRITKTKTASIIDAAQWFAGQTIPPQPIIQELRRRFALTGSEAAQACTLANSFRTAKRAIG